MRIRSVDLYISLTIVVAVAALAAGATLARSDGLEWAWWGAALLTGMSIVAERRSVMMPGGTHEATLSNGQKLQVSRIQSRILRQRFLKL